MPLSPTQFKRLTSLLSADADVELKPAQEANPGNPELRALAQALGLD